MDTVFLFLVSDCFGFFFVTIETNSRIATKNRLKLKDRAIARSDFYAKRLVAMSFNNCSTRACWIRYFVRLPETLTFWRKHLFQCIWVIDQV